MTHKTDTKKISYGGGYTSPRIEVTPALSEQGFAASSPVSWNDGSIPNDYSKYNFWDQL